MADEGKLAELLERVDACETILNGTRPATVDEMRLVIQEVVGILEDTLRALIANERKT